MSICFCEGAQRPSTVDNPHALPHEALLVVLYWPRCAPSQTYRTKFPARAMPTPARPDRRGRLRQPRVEVGQPSTDARTRSLIPQRSFERLTSSTRATTTLSLRWRGVSGVLSGASSPSWTRTALGTPMSGSAASNPTRTSNGTSPSAACAPHCTAHSLSHWVRFGVEVATLQRARLCKACLTLCVICMNWSLPVTPSLDACCIYTSSRARPHSGQHWSGSLRPPCSLTHTLICAGRW